MTFSVYSTSDANGEQGAKRCIYDELLKDFTHDYTFEYLVQFFEDKAREYFYEAIREDEKYFICKRVFQGEKEHVIDFSKEENYLTVLKILRIVKTLQYFYDRGYDFKITNISTDHNGWIMNFTFDFTNLSKEQIEILRAYAFERD